MSIFDMFSSFFSPDEGYKKAREQFERFWQDTQNRQQPYVNQGQEQYGNLMGARDQLMHPDQLLNDWIQKYEMSPYAQQEIANSKAQGMDVASGMGLLGSSTATEGIQHTATDIANRDRREYLNDLMQKYLSGIGISSGIYEGGRATAGELGREGAQYGQDIAGTAYGQQNAPGNLLGQLINTGANLAGNYFTGGAYGAANAGANMANRGSNFGTNWGMAA